MLLRALISTPLLWIMAALAPACASASHAEANPPSKPPAGADAEQQVAAARDKLSLARMQLEITRKKTEDARGRQERELELSRAELAEFDEVDSQNRIARATLELTRRQDALSEQQEELAQLEMMYEKEDLADKTREIVLQRGKRRVERAKEELAIEEREKKGLETRTLPRERSKLALEVESKAHELEGMAPEAEATMLEKKMAVQAAEADVRAAEAKAGTKS